MKIGFMPEFKDLEQEFKFANSYFDFIEITLPEVRQLTVFNPDNYNFEYIKKFKRFARSDFQIFGHLHWGFDLSKNWNDDNVAKLAHKILNIFCDLNVRLVTLHPSSWLKNSNVNEVLQSELDLIIQNNKKHLKMLNKFAKDMGIILSLENLDIYPMNDPNVLYELLYESGINNFTMDLGHIRVSNKASVDDFINTFQNKIKHSHVHSVVMGVDHKQYSKFSDLFQDLKILKQAGIGTATLEIFDFEDTQSRHNELISYIEQIKQII